MAEEDRLRRASLRAASQMRELEQTASAPDFLRSLQGAVTLDYRKNPSDKRPLELINKTNQFNLNGLRIGEGEWQRCIEKEEALLSVVSYQDKFGPLGKIAVLLGEQGGRPNPCLSLGNELPRFFPRHPEYHTLEGLFRQTHAEAIEFDFRVTERNSPWQDFFRQVGGSTARAENPQSFPFSVFDTLRFVATPSLRVNLMNDINEAARPLFSPTCSPTSNPMRFRKRAQLRWLPGSSLGAT